MNELNISAVDATAMETATTTSAPKHKWLSKLTRGAKKATMFCTVAGIMASTCATQASIKHLTRSIIALMSVGSFSILFLSFLITEPY